MLLLSEFELAARSINSLALRIHCKGQGFGLELLGLKTLRM